jgi:beta-lactam-binding protein with PASTA domain
MKVATMTTDVYVEQRWIDIPSVFGMTVRDASERLAEAGFAPVASPRRFSADAGDVVGGTIPPEGSSWQRAGRIDLLPARKKTAVPLADEKLTPDELLDLGIMPNLAGWSANDALGFLQAHGLHTWPRGTFTDKVDPDFVVFTDPRAGQAADFEPVVVWYAIPLPPPDPPRDMTPEMVMKPPT